MAVALSTADLVDSSRQAPRPTAARRDATRTYPIGLRDVWSLKCSTLRHSHRVAQTKPLTFVCPERVIKCAVHVEPQGEPMFIQVIEGTSDRPDVLHRRLEVWNRELKPGAIGYLGSTGGCTAYGDCIMVVRFESRDAAYRNSDRPEQTAWWEVTNRYFVGPVRFHESEDVQVKTHGALGSTRNWCRRWMGMSLISSALTPLSPTPTLSLRRSAPICSDRLPPTSTTASSPSSPTSP